MDTVVLNSLPVKHYQIDQTPPFDQVKNLDGFISWDVVDPINPICSEGLSYANDNLVINTELVLYIYSNRLLDRSNLVVAVLDALQPKVSGKRTFLKGVEFTNGFLRHLVLKEHNDYPVSKTGQSVPEMSAAVMTFVYSISIEED